MIAKIVIFSLIGQAFAAVPRADTDFATCEFTAEEGNSVVFIREISHGLFGTTTEVYGKINGLTDGLHGFHVHQFGELGNGCLDAGGHFDPDQTENTTGEYVGDLGSLESTDGRVVFRKEKSAIKLSGPEDRNVLNRALVIHADPTGGDRVMCCTIRAF